MTPDTTNDSVLTLEAAAGTATAKRPTYWRHFGEYANGEQIDEFVHREFPSMVNELLDPVSRRNFFKVMGASMMLAGVAGCARQPEEKIVPYVKPPEENVQGKPSYYTTAMTLGGYGIGLVATSYEGRPTKLEGLAEHPSSLGSTDLWAQASILEMYDPERLDSVNYAAQISTWARFVKETTTKLAELDAAAGAGLALLTETVTSPTLAWQINKLLARYPGAKWYQWDGINYDNVRRGSQMAFGSIVNTVYDFAKAKVVLSLDSDFLHDGPGRVRYSRDFAKSRDFDHNGGTMSRLYVAESSPTLTGAAADHKVTVCQPDVETLARTIATSLGIVNAAPASKCLVPDAWVGAVLKDLQDAGGAAIVTVGSHQPAVVHALAHAINEKLGAVAVGTVRHIESVEQNPVIQLDSITELNGEIVKGNVKLLVMLGGNPVYTTPGDLKFGETLRGSADMIRVHLTESENETTHECHWAIPQAHYLEGWSDVRGHDGTVSIIQPLILPLYNGKTAHEVLAAMLGNDTASAYDLLVESWKARRGPEQFDIYWKNILGKGIVEGTESPVKNVQCAAQFPPQEEVKHSGLDVMFRLDPNVLDGRFTNNAWLQELPRQLTRLVWDNVITMHPETAKANGLKHEDVAELTVGNSSITGPVLIQYGHAKDAVTIHLGYGRTYCGKVGAGVGFNAASIRSAKSAWFATGAKIANTGKCYELSRTEEHWNIEQSLKEQSDVAEARHLIREGSLATYTSDKEFAQKLGHPAPSEDLTLYNPEEKKWVVDHRWAMTIDLNKCTGCGVCTIACQSENNIPVVGKTDVRIGREMHWIRIDRYYKGDFDGEIETVHQPIPCMQCENAPCEPVCPVGATQHSREGLNDMSYNRCIGTRYCLNNCPYKVRRFNFFKYADHHTPQLKMMRNPNVTVRSRGVIEKCTYCVQRINIARIDAKRDGNGIIADGAVIPACQQACPSDAITFGNINDAESRVSKERANPRNYGLLADIGTRPRTTYLAKLRNTSAMLAKNEPAAEGHH